MYSAKNVRPRSSLSTDENHRIKDTRCYKKSNNTLLTLIAFCVFLLVLCVFLLGALVYVGKNIAEEKMAAANQTADVSFSQDMLELIWNKEQLLSTKPIISARPGTVLLSTTTQIPAFQPNDDMHATISAAVQAASKVLSKLQYRIPHELRPHKYQLKVQPNLKTKRFDGNVTIRFEVLAPIAFIPVHAKDLNVKTSEVQQLSDSGAPLRKLEPTLSFNYPLYEYWVTEFAQPLEKGNYSIKLQFDGTLEGRVVGFYQSNYWDKANNSRRWIATTKFEPTYARLAFPCFDEPNLKAQFTLTVVRPTEGGYHALSNMDIENEEVQDSVTEVTFKESVPMSTYLVSFIVSDFKSKSKTVKGVLPNATGFELRAFATPTQVDKVEFALDTAVAVTEFYIDYFNVLYPLPKLDIVGIPDFASGAMENWGLVTFRESLLLYSEDSSSVDNKQRVALVVAHELAHMWFGNLVTMKWWNDLWLNEGFATFLQYLSINKVYPEWNALSQFITDKMNDVMDLDSTLASHPIVKSVESPDEITAFFDTITYSKGASVVRMLEDLVGAEAFRNATTRYLSNHMYNTATTDDFLTAIEEANLDFDVKLIMQTWTEQMGLPVVEVTKDGNSYKLTQKRFLLNRDDYNAVHETSNFNYRWSIPISYYSSADKAVKKTIFNYNDNEVTLTASSGSEWIKINKDQIGYYRVNYPVELWKTFTTVLNSARGEFSVADRANLLNDAFVLADAAQLNYSYALDLSTYLNKELDYLPWSLAQSKFAEIKKVLYYTDAYSSFTKYVRRLSGPVAEKLTFEPDNDHLNNLLRKAVLSTACASGYEPCLKEAAKRFNAWLAKPEERPNPNIRIITYYYGMDQVGNEEIWDQVWQIYLAEADAEEKMKLLKTLSAINVPWILKRYIDLAWDEKNVRRQNYFSCLGFIAENPIGAYIVWDYVRENWPKYVERFGVNDRYLGTFVSAITKKFATKTKLEEMETFFKKYPEAGAGAAGRKIAIESVKNNIKWLENNKQQIVDWLDQQDNETVTTNRIE